MLCFKTELVLASQKLKSRAHQLREEAARLEEQAAALIGYASELRFRRAACPHCRGTGQVWRYADGPEMRDKVYEPCLECEE